MLVLGQSGDENQLFVSKLTKKQQATLLFCILRKHKEGNLLLKRTQSNYDSPCYLSIGYKEPLSSRFKHVNRR